MFHQAVSSFQGQNDFWLRIALNYIFDPSLFSIHLVAAGCTAVQCFTSHEHPVVEAFRTFIQDFHLHAFGWYMGWANWLFGKCFACWGPQQHKSPEGNGPFKVLENIQRVCMIICTRTVSYMLIYIYMYNNLYVYTCIIGFITQCVWQFTTVFSSIRGDSLSLWWAAMDHCTNKARTDPQLQQSQRACFLHCTQSK